MSSYFSLEQIANHMVTDRVALQGVSAETYEQNLRIVEALRAAGPEMGERVLGIQIIGSRANGTSDVSSDLDLAVIKLGSDPKADIDSTIREVTSGLVDSTDTCNAAWVVDIPCLVPANVPSFMKWVRKWPLDMAGLLEDGIYASDAMLALRVAALATLSTACEPEEAEARWQHIGIRHTHLYLSKVDRLRHKLSQRLPDSSLAVIAKIINQNLMDERRKVVSLQGSLYEQQAHLTKSLSEIPAALRTGLAFEIYEEVMGQMQSDGPVTT